VLDEGGRAQVLPGYPQIKLWADSAELLERPTDGLRRVRQELAKFALPAADRLADRPAPLHAIYALRPHNGPELHLEPLQDSTKFNVLLDYTFQKLALKNMGRHTAHFRMAVAVANGVCVARVTRPQHPFLLDELADLIEEDFR